MGKVNEQSVLPISSVVWFVVEFLWNCLFVLVNHHSCIDRKFLSCNFLFVLCSLLITMMMLR